MEAVSLPAVTSSELCDVASTPLATPAIKSEVISVAAVESEVTSQQPKQRAVSDLPDNIMSDHNDLVEELKALSAPTLEDPTGIPSEYSTPTVPATFAREPTAVDNYISLVTAWKEAEDAEDVVIITPNSANLSSIGSSINVGMGGKEHYSAYEPYKVYESDDDAQSPNDLEEKIDATYNKLCSLEIATSDSVEVIHHVNGQLENINRNCFSNVKDINTLKLRVDNIALDVNTIHRKLDNLASEMCDIKHMLVALIRQRAVACQDGSEASGK